MAVNASPHKFHNPRTKAALKARCTYSIICNSDVLICVYDRQAAGGRKPRRKGKSGGKQAKERVRGKRDGVDTLGQTNEQINRPTDKRTYGGNHFWTCKDSSAEMTLTWSHSKLSRAKDSREKQSRAEQMSLIKRRCFIVYL